MKTILFIASLFFCSALSYAQEIKLNEVDEFTGNRRIETSWQRVNYSMKGYCSYINLQLLNGKQYLGLKVLTNFVCSVLEGSELLFKTEDGGVYKLKAIENIISGKGDGSVGLQGSSGEGIYVRYTGDFSFLSKSTLGKIRVYMRDKYIDIEITDKYKDKIKVIHNLFNSELDK